MDAPLTLTGQAPARRTPSRLALAGDERLARLVGAGDERAFVALYSRYHQQLYRYCRSLLGHEADAQDALQATFADAFTALQRGQRDAPLRPWLYRIAHNESITVLRRRRGHDELDEQAGGVSPSVEEQAARRERLATLVADLRELPERQRAALVMRELSGLSHEDIALALRTSIGAAKQTVFEARRSLQEFEQGRAMDCEEICRLVSDGDRRALRGRRLRAHLRSCSDCAAFAAAIPARRKSLNALAPPLAPVAAGGMLASLLGQAGARHVSAGHAAGLAGKSAGLALGSKALVGVVLVAGASAGLGTALTHPHRVAPAHTGSPLHGHSGHGQSAAPTAIGVQPAAGSLHGRGAVRSTPGERNASRVVPSGAGAAAASDAAAARGIGRHAPAHTRGRSSPNTITRHGGSRVTSRTRPHGRAGLETGESHGRQPPPGSPNPGASSTPAHAHEPPAAPQARAGATHSNATGAGESP